MNFSLCHPKYRPRLHKKRLVHLTEEGDRVLIR